MRSVWLACMISCLIYWASALLAARADAPTMVGKDAPDFKGDFAVNGNPLKLSDLKGKVVLLAFWEVRSTPGSRRWIPTASGWPN